MTIHVPAPDSSGTVELQSYIDGAHDGDTLLLAEGVYAADPTAFIDSLCGNCEEHRTPVEATVGFIVRGKGIVIIGRSPSETILETNAGYGIFFDRSRGSVLAAVTVTGGRRDPDGNATDAAVVARMSRVTVTGCEIIGNTSRIDTVVVGIGGVFGREGADLYIYDNRILDTGWDGVALYRGATAVIADNEISRGRGAGIGITWDAVATVTGNRVSHFWKGIGTFGDSRAVVRGNAVCDNLGWGIIATGTSELDATGNVVNHNGNCGLAVWSETCRARFTNNIVTKNGWRKEWVCPCVGVWMNGKNKQAEFSYNDIWGNEAGNYQDLPDLTGRDGNVSIDPEFPSNSNFELPAGSPLVDAGNPLITDPDGTRSDIGIAKSRYPLLTPVRVRLYRKGPAPSPDTGPRMRGKKSE
ncbi:MAG: right-handed parallel beta-helix repeat-containing protein [bacterium]|nr:MAG: right-handed parallel beta-helix repeat-containing protein [bacterium]